MGRFGFLFTRWLQAPRWGCREGGGGCGEGVLCFNESLTRRLQVLPRSRGPALPHPRRARSFHRVLSSSPPRPARVRWREGMDSPRDAPSRSPGKKDSVRGERRWGLIDAPFSEAFIHRARSCPGATSGVSRLDPHRPAPASRSRGSRPSKPTPAALAEAHQRRHTGFKNQSMERDAWKHVLKAHPEILPPAVSNALKNWTRMRTLENKFRFQIDFFHVRESN